MNKNEAIEAASIIERVLLSLVALPQDRTTAEAADLRRSAGGLSAAAYDRVQAASIGLPLFECFTLARIAGVARSGFTRVRTQILAEAPLKPAGKIVAQLGVRLTLAQEVILIAETTFVSRADVDDVLAAMDAAFDQAEEVAADEQDSGTYRALVAMHGALVSDLTDRARPLPRIAPYKTAKSMPSLALANYLYGDGGRADELRLENRVPHPAFMPLQGRALSA